MPRPFRPRDARPDPRRDVPDELRFHLDMRAEEFAARGLAPDDARRAAEASFGDVAAVRSECERAPLARVAGVVFAAATAASAGGARIGPIGARATAGRRGRADRRALVAAEIALSLVLLTGAGLLARSFARLHAVAPGFDAAGVMTAGVLAPNVGGYDVQRDGPRWRALFTGYPGRLAAQPRIAAAGGVSGLPLTGRVEFTGVQIPGRARSPTESRRRRRCTTSSARSSR